MQKLATKYLTFFGTCDGWNRLEAFILSEIRLFAVSLPGLLTPAHGGVLGFVHAEGHGEN
jgi:hypothetical protein